LGAGCSELNSSTVECTLSSLAAGGFHTFSFVGLIADSVEPGVQLRNRAEATTTTAENNLLNNVDTADTDVLTMADLMVTKYGPAYVAAGDVITYMLVVENEGPSMAWNVDVKDQLPDGLSLMATFITSSLDDDVALCGGTVCQLGNVSAGEVVTVTIVAQVDPTLTAGTMLYNEAAVFSTTSDPESGNNTDDTWTEVVIYADLEVSKVDVSDPVIAGERIQYIVTVRNNGPSIATEVVLTDVLPTQVTWDDSVSDTRCLLEGDEIVCSIGVLQPGQFTEILLSGMVDAIMPHNTIITNNAMVEGAEPDSDLDNNDVSEDTVIESYADLSFTKTADKDLYLVGLPATFELVVTNHGPNIAAYVSITDDLPGNMFVATAYATQGVCVYDGTLVTCDLMHLGVHESITITIVAFANEEGSFDNVAFANSLSLDEDLSDNEPSVSFDVFNELQDVYAVCFAKNTAYPEWSINQFSTTPGTSTVQGARPKTDFLGEFGSGEFVTLSVAGLPEHERVRAELELFIIRSWDGNTVTDPFVPSAVIGPDILQVKDVTNPVDEKLLMNATFLSWSLVDQFQSYPENHPVGPQQPQTLLASVNYLRSAEAIPQFPAFTGASEIGTLGYVYKETVNQDAIYDVELLFNHNAENLNLKIGAPQLQAIFDESWGLACVNIHLQGVDVNFSRLYLPLIVR
jgi:uncharacterized repeat protein (TIGR01451 family)